MNDERFFIAIQFTFQYIYWSDFHLIKTFLICSTDEDVGYRFTSAQIPPSLPGR